jgi:hypothetical protein
VPLPLERYVLDVHAQKKDGRWLVEPIEVERFWSAGELWERVVLLAVGLGENVRWRR